MPKLRTIERSFYCLLIAASLLTGARSGAQGLPEIDFTRYEWMDYSKYDQQTGWTLESRVVPHYTGGVMDTVFINQHNGDMTFSPFRRIRYTPFSLFPEKVITEQWNGAWITIRTDSFAYINGIRTMKLSKLLEGGMLDSTTRSKYEYTGEGKILSRVDEALVNGNWVLQKKVAYIYDDAYNVLGLEDSTFNGQIFQHTGRELQDYVDGALDEITREIGLHPNFTGIEKFRYWHTKKWNPALTYSVEGPLSFDTLTGTKQTRHLIIRNPNTEPVIVAGVKIRSGKLFKLRDAIQTSYAIPANSELRVAIEFAPTVRGSFVDSVTVTVDGGVNTTVALLGDAHGGLLVHSPSSLDFGTVLPGDTASRFLNLSNGGDAPIQIDSIVSLHPAFVIRDTISSQLNSPVTLSVPLYFSPLSPGQYNGSFRVHYHNGVRSLDTVINAKGVGAENTELRGILALDKILLDFDTIYVGDTASLLVALSNIGDMTIRLDTAIASTSAFEASPLEIKTLSPSELTHLRLHFVPTFSGDYQATIQIRYNDSRDDLDTLIKVGGVAIYKPVESVEVDSSSVMRVYPNPAANRIYFENEGLHINSAYFVLLTGERIEIERHELNEGSISTSKLPSGSVTLIMETPTGMITNRLMIVR